MVPDKRYNWLKPCLVGDGLVGNVIEPTDVKYLSLTLHMERRVNFTDSTTVSEFLCMLSRFFLFRFSFFYNHVAFLMPCVTLSRILSVFERSLGLNLSTTSTVNNCYYNPHIHWYGAALGHNLRPVLHFRVHLAAYRPTL